MLFVFRLIDFRQRFELARSHFEARVLVEFHEGESHRVNERRDRGHEEIDAVPDEQDQQDHQLAHHRNIGAQARSQVVEDRGQDTARKADREQTDVRQHVGKDARYIIIGIPKSGSEIHERVLARRVEEKHQHHADGRHAVEGG